jgi:hypothetical protein
MGDSNSHNRVPKLERDPGFEVWEIQMKIFLQLKSEQGTYLSNSFQAVDNLTPFSRRKARGYILQALAREDLMAVHEMDTVPAVIAWLKRKYVGNIQSRMMGLMGEFGSIRMKKGQTVSEVIERIHKIVRELDVVGQPQSEHAVIAAILNAMPKEYANTVERLVDQEVDALNPITVERVRTSLLRKENQLAEGTSPQLETKALLAIHSSSGEKRGAPQDDPKTICHKCGYTCHWARDCFSKRIKEGFTPRLQRPPGPPGPPAPAAGGRGFNPRGRGRGRSGRHPGGRGAGQRVLAIREAGEEEQEQAAWPQESSTQPGPNGRITLSLTPEMLSRMMYKGTGPSPHLAYTKPAADDSGDPSPVELAEMMRCILDSGAGVSVSPLLHALTEYTTFGKNVGCANDTYMPAYGSGTLSATSHQEGGSLHIDLPDVWHVPACKHTLISVKQLQRLGCWALIQDNWIQYYNKRNERLFLALETDLGFEIQWDLHVPVKHVPVELHEHEHGHRVHHATTQTARAAPVAEGESAEGVHVQYISSQT